MKFESTEVWGFKHALRGMRNPLESWDKSDSFFPANCGTDCPYDNCSQTEGIELGKNDLALAQSLIKAGSEHRKFMRQIFVSVDITAPLYWWKEFDTYKISTVANSTSTMHKLASTPITKDCFEMDDFEEVIEAKVIEAKDFAYSAEVYWRNTVKHLEELRELYVRTKNIRLWKELIRELPESWLQKRTVTMDYENILSMIRQRKNHKLTEWSKAFIDWAKALPYAEELLFLQKEEEK